MNFEQALDDVVSNIVKRAEDNARQEKPWQDLWEASENNIHNLLDAAHNQMRKIVLDTTQVIKERFGIKHVSPHLYALIQMLPYAMSQVSEEIRNKQGLSCCVDKARKVYCDEVIVEINRIKSESSNEIQSPAS